MISGLNYDIYDYDKILKHFKKVALRDQTFNCNGAKKQDKQTGEQLIQLSGDHRKEIADFFYHEGIAEREEIKVHGVM